ncbi:MAG: hypothetical protein WAV41_00435 [Microgenomates group bacterium]
MQNKILFLFFWLSIFLFVTTDTALAYNINISLDNYGNATYSFPSVLGDDDQPEKPDTEKKEESKEEKKEEKKSEKSEVRETPNTSRPEKIEIKREENKSKVTLKKSDKSKQELRPDKVKLKFSAVPKLTPTPKMEVEDEANDSSDDVTKVVEDRANRTNEKVEFQSEVHDDGTVEMQLESRNIKAKIKSDEIELDVKNNNIGMTNNAGVQTTLVHLPDQVITKFLELGISSTPDSLEIGQSAEGFVYKSKSIKNQNLFGIFPRQVEYDVSLNDSTGDITQQKSAANFVQQFLNLFTF